MRRRHWLFILLTATLSIAVALAQTNGCPAFVEQALVTVAENCEDMPRNQACYGNTRLRAEFQEPVDDDFFTQPSDLAELTSVSSIEALPYAPIADQWGIAVLNVQANVPNALPGQAVTFMLLGDTQVENRVDPEIAFSPVDGVVVEPLPETNLRTGPGRDFKVVANTGDGGEYIADGISEDRDWLRILVDSTPLWVFVDLIPEVPFGVANLPTLTDDLRTPMQSFYFTSSIGQPNCQEAPNSLVIQSAPTMDVTLDMNGLTIVQGSTAVYRFVEANVIQISVFEGKISLSERFSIPVGSTAFVRTEDDGTIIPGSWFGFRSLSAAEYDQYFWMEYYDQSYFRPLGRFARPSIQLVPVGDCDAFIRTSPITETIKTAPVDFYWDPPAIPGVTRYEIIFYNENSEPTDSFIVDAPTTTIRLDVGLLGTGSVLRWDVIAYIGDDAVCATGPSEFQVREANIGIEDIVETSDDDGEEFEAVVQCHPPGSGVPQIDVIWTNAASAELLTFTYTCGGVPNTINFGSGATGSGINGPIVCGGVFGGGSLTSPSQGTVAIGALGAACPP